MANLPSYLGSIRAAWPVGRSATKKQIGRSANYRDDDGRRGLELLHPFQLFNFSTFQLADQLHATTEPETPPHDLRPPQCNHHGALVRRGRKRKGFAPSSNAIQRRKPFMPSPACPNTDAMPANTSGWTTNWSLAHTSLIGRYAPEELRFCTK